MRRLIGLAVLYCLGSIGAVAQEPEKPAVEGYITRVASSSDFDANGIRIQCGTETRTGRSNDVVYAPGCPGEPLYVGEGIQVFGNLSKKRDVVKAGKIVLKAGGPLEEIHGSAVIDAVPQRDLAGEPTGSLMVRADGYWILIPPAAPMVQTLPTKKGNAAVRPGQDIHANMWIDYRARQRADGVLVAEWVRFSPNGLTTREERIRDKVQYDPTAATAASKQSAFAAGFVGVNFKRIPPWPDSAMQDRVQAVGEKLIPGYQTALPDSDPAKIDFEFQVVDANWGLAVLGLPNGVILVPHKTVERMKNDAQLAALLGDSMASVLEKQTYRMRTTINALNGVQAASILASFVPLTGLGTGIWLSAAGTEGVVIHREMEQSERVSLELMHDAGYDIQQAPLAWWLLSSRDPKPSSPELDGGSPVAYLYRTLGTVWRSSPGAERNAPQSPGGSTAATP